MSKKALVLVIVCVLVGGGIFLANRSGHAPAGSGDMSSSSNIPQAGGETPGTDIGGSGVDGKIADTSDAIPELPAGEEIPAAAKVYQSADEAMDAIRKGAANFDDALIEQFREPGDDCTWCGQLYAQLKDVLTDPKTKREEVPFYGEILAVSGRVENLKILADLIQSSQDPDMQEAYAQALELATGKDKVVPYLTEELNSPVERLREASVAALTNQGTRSAAESLYNNTVQRGDPDGYYTVGIGLGEFVPEPESLPYLQTLAAKRDQYSHLAVKALLNGGLPGLKMVFETLATSKDPESDRKMLKDSLEHVLVDKETEDYVHQMVLSSDQGLVKEFGNDILTRFSQEEAPPGDGDEGDSDAE